MDKLKEGSDAIMPIDLLFKNISKPVIDTTIY